MIIILLLIMTVLGDGCFTCFSNARELLGPNSNSNVQLGHMVQKLIYMPGIHEFPMEETMLQLMIDQIRARTRARKLQHFFELTKPSQNCSILDVGAADEEYSPIDNFLEKHYPYPENITALSIYPLNLFRERYPGINAVTYSGGRFPFADKQFSIAHSNAVLEHVGEKAAQILFLEEIERVSLMFYLTTPAREFPIEQHTRFPLVHWLPKPTFDKLAVCLGKPWAAGDYMHLLSKRALRELLREARVKNYRIVTQGFGFLPLSYLVLGWK